MNLQGSVKNNRVLKNNMTYRTNCATTCLLESRRANDYKVKDTAIVNNKVLYVIDISYHDIFNKINGILCVFQY